MKTTIITEIVSYTVRRRLFCLGLFCNRRVIWFWKDSVIFLIRNHFGWARVGYFVTSRLFCAIKFLKLLNNRHPPISRLLGFLRPLWPEIFENLVGLTSYALQNGKQRFLKFDPWTEIWHLKVTHWFYLKKLRHVFFSSNVQKNPFCPIFLFEKKPWGHSRAFRANGVKFQISPNIDKLYLKMKLVTRAFQQS